VGHFRGAHLDSLLYKERYEGLRDGAYASLEGYVRLFEGSDSLRGIIEYALLGSGKLFRPVLLAAVSEAVGVSLDRISRIQLSVELVHASSLIHDDLPCLDDDDMRRGKPSCHKVFGEGLSLLAGDYLLASASRELLLIKEDPSVVASVTFLLNDTICKMCEGQILDLEIRNPIKIKNLSEDGLKTLLEDVNLKKTGALIHFSVMVPLFLASNLSEEEKSSIERYAENLSILFQLCDDLLDSKHDTKAIEYREINYVDVLGIEKAGDYADTLVQDSIDALQFLGERGDFLKYLVRYVRNQ
jgi:geranylgeranyl pyrophosphate synthase